LYIRVVKMNISIDKWFSISMLLSRLSNMLYIYLIGFVNSHPYLIFQLAKSC
jgi:hypothetical protein